MALAVFNSAAFSVASGVAVAASASVEVRRESDGALASIFSDRDGGTPKANPFSADSNGRFEFYAAGIEAGYQITVTYNAESHTLNNVAIGTAGERDAGAAGAEIMAAATKGAAHQAFDRATEDRAANTMLVYEDWGKPLRATASFTQTFDDVEDLADGWWVDYRVDAGVTIVFEGFGSPPQSIDGAGSVTVNGPAEFRIFCDGEALFTRGTPKLPTGYISGLVMSQAADTDHDITISAGACKDSTGKYDLHLASALTKQIDAAWAAGNNAGGLDTGVVGSSSWYAIWAIRKDSDGSVDALFSLSFSAPTMPAGYTAKRLIGAVLSNVGANIVAFWAYEKAGGALKIEWDLPPEDVAVTNQSTTEVLRRLSVPPLTVDARVRVAIDNAGAVMVTLRNPDSTSTVTPSVSAGTEHGTLRFEGATNAFFLGTFEVQTDSSGQIGSQASAASTTVRIVTESFIMHRRV